MGVLLKNDEFSTNNDGFCTTNYGLYTKNDGFLLEIDGFCTKSHVAAPFFLARVGVFY